MAHGNWSYHIEGSVMYVELIGQFNVQGLNKFFQEMRTAANNYPKNITNHAVVNLADWELVTDDSRALAKQYFENMISRGYKKVDYLMPSNNLVKHVLLDTWKDINIEVNFYNSIDAFLKINPSCNYVENWMFNTEATKVSH